MSLVRVHTETRVLYNADQEIYDEDYLVVELEVRVDGVAKEVEISLSTNEALDLFYSIENFIK